MPQSGLPFDGTLRLVAGEALQQWDREKRKGKPQQLRMLVFPLQP